MNQKELIEIPSEKNQILQLMYKYKDYDLQVAFESGNMSRYFYRLLESCDHVKKIHVVHPQKFKIISESKHKNDKKDCKRLAKALLKDYLPYPVHIKSEKSRKLQLLLNLRKNAVNNRKVVILQAKSIIRSLGIQMESKKIVSKIGFQKVIELVDSELFEYEYLQRLFQSYKQFHDEVYSIEKEISTVLETDFQGKTELLTSIPGIGIITTATFLSVVDDINRFQDADKISSYFGLVPSEHSSGEKVIHGRITRQGNNDMRSLMIQAAWVAINRIKANDIRMEKLRKKFYRLAAQNRNTQKAIVAVARHLTRIAFGVLKNGEPYRVV